MENADGRERRGDETGGRPVARRQRAGVTPSVCFVSLYAYAYFDAAETLPLGGAERQLTLVARELTDAFDVQFVVGDFGQPAVQSHDDITVHRAYDPRLDRGGWQTGRAVGRLFRAMRRADADVYVFRGEHTRAVLTSALASALGKRWVYNLARDDHASPADGLGGRLTRPVVERTLAGADGLIAQNDRQRDRLGSAFGVDATVVPNGYPPTAASPSYDSRTEFLFVGRIEERQKRPHLFVELAKRVPEASFTLVGPESGTEAYCDQIASAADSLDNLDFPGRVDPAAIHDHYQRAIALVNTSVREGFPNTFLEAWRAGTPVLSLDVDPGRFLDGGEAGYADGDFDSLVELVERFEASPSERERLGRHSKRAFDETYHIETVADQYADVLRNTLE